MRKKETLWELLERLDEQAGAFDGLLDKSNQYFDKASQQTKDLLRRHRKDLHTTITGIRRAMKSFRPGEKPTGKKKGNAD